MTDFGAKRPQVRLDAVNRPFWTGGAEGKLNICKCGDCGTFIHPPQPICRNCRSENVGPHAVSGKGRVSTFTINHQPWMPGLKTPFVIARVTLDDAPGVILTTNIVGCEPDEVCFDDAVAVTFQNEGDIWYPLFEKAGAA